MKKRIWSDRQVLLFSIGATVVALPLTYLNPLFAILSGLTWALVSYYLLDFISRILFAKGFHPPSRYASEWDSTRRASDWILLVPYLLVFVCLLFAFGEIGDCIGGRDVWKSGWELCEFK